jgi:hypothetical protein
MIYLSQQPIIIVDKYLSNEQFLSLAQEGRDEKEE